MKVTHFNYRYLFPLILLVGFCAAILTHHQSTVSLPIQDDSSLIIKPSTGAYNYENTTNKFQTYFKANPVIPNAIKFANALAAIAFYTSPTQVFANASSTDTPTITANAITYPNLFPQTDLKYSLSPARLLEEFVVKDKGTAQNITKITQKASTVNIDTYQENEGKITFFREGKPAFVIPKPVMYESENQNVKSYGISYEISRQSTDQFTISKVITDEGKQWLNDPARVYPIVIDLVIDNADTDTNWVSSDATNTPVSGETTIKHEGAGSVKVQTTANSSTTIDLMEYSSDANAQTGYPTNAIIASGGTETTSGVYRIHTFTTNGTFAVTNGGNVEVLVVGGGGGGGNGINGNGGGGAGGFVSNSSFSVSSGNISVTVGDTVAVNTSGNNSVFSTITAYGGGAGGAASDAGSSGGSGGGGGCRDMSGAGGTAGQGYAGGNGVYAAGGGGGGAGGAGTDGYGASSNWGGSGGIGVASSISGSSIYYAGGGAAGGSATGGCGSAQSGGTACGTNAVANRGAGGGGNSAAGTAGTGGSGIVIVRYPDLTLQSYSEATIKTQGSYSLKGVAKATNSLNKTLIRTIASPIDLSNKNSVTFDIRGSRTGSNLKIGLHDSGGTTTEVTPNITSANTFQSATIDLSGVSNANKDVIDQIIITITNADADNTFYFDNLTSSDTPSLNDTVTLTKSATDLSTTLSISLWIRSTLAGQTLRFQFGESVNDEQVFPLTINNANTWEEKIINISEVSAAAKNAVTKFAFKVTDGTTAQTFYFDEVIIPDPVTRMSGVTMSGVVLNGPLHFVSGPNSPGTMANDASVGTMAWTNPDNAKINDTSYVYVSPGFTGATQYLKATNFGFSIPTGATINGIVMEAELYSQDDGFYGYSYDYSVKLVKGGTISGNNNAKPSSNHWPTSAQYRSWGSSSDLWGLALTATDINAGNFGAVISKGEVPQDASPDGYVDHIRITVYYTQ